MPGSLDRPGPVPAGEYTSKNFFGGQLSVTIPGDDWWSGEDSTGELKLQHGSVEGTSLDFWLDIYPIVDGKWTKVDGYDGSAKALFDWVAANPNIRVSNRGPASLGGVDAEVMDFQSSRNAKNVDPSCPSQFLPCVGMFGYFQWDDTYNQGGPFRLRLYGADVTYGGTKHAVYGMITADNPSLFKEFAPLASKIVEGARLPDGVAQ